MTAEKQLAHFDAAKRELALAATIDEVKLIRDKAEALRQYIRQQGKSAEMQNCCAEIKIRAERKAGEMLRDMDREKPGEYKKLHDETFYKKPGLEQLGISRIQSHRWQQAATVPEEVLEEYIAETKEKGGEITSAGVQRLVIKTQQREEQPPPEMPQDKYNIILADPPWEYEFSQTITRTIENHYSTMSLDNIKKLNIPAANNAVLLLWATAPKLEEALQVMNAWGFIYRTCAVWDKGKMGMGYWFRIQHELLLVGLKGNYHAPEPQNRHRSIICSPREGHSEKPDIIYEIIENMFPDGKYLELFARTKRPGWECWGLEAQ